MVIATGGKMKNKHFFNYLRDYLFRNNDIPLHNNGQPLS